MPWVYYALLAVILGLFAVFLRGFRVVTSYEIFIDEPTYVNLGRSFAGGAGSVLYEEPFHLHPPLFFILLGRVIAYLPQMETIDLVLDLRYVNVVLAGLTGALLFMISARIGGAVAGFAVALLFAVDPYLIRFDSRILLETSAMMWTVLGYFLLLASGSARTDARSSAFAAAGGLSLGCALITKDTTAFLSLLPLGIVFLTGWGIRRRESLLAAIGTVAVYAVYLLSVVLSGQLSEWAFAKARGVLRLLGFIQETGFNSEGVPSLSERLVANLDVFGTSYVFVIFGSLASLGILAAHTRFARYLPLDSEIVAARVEGSANRVARPLVLISVWQLSAVAFLAYAILFGTIEEQMFYFLVVPSIVSIVLFCHLLVGASRVRLLAPVLGIAFAGFVVFGGAAWARIHTTTDDSYATLVRWADAELPEGSRVSVTEDTSQFLLTGLDIGQWHTVQELRVNDVAYVVVSTELVEQGYSDVDEDFVAYLDREASVVFESEGRTLGSLRVYDVRTLSGFDPA